jgi:hypothetical protein
MSESAEKLRNSTTSSEMAISEGKRVYIWVLSKDKQL